MKNYLKQNYHFSLYLFKDISLSYFSQIITKGKIGTRNQDIDNKINHYLDCFKSLIKGKSINSLPEAQYSIFEHIDTPNHNEKILYKVTKEYFKNYKKKNHQTEKLDLENLSSLNDKYLDFYKKLDKENIRASAFLEILDLHLDATKQGIRNQLDTRILIEFLDEFSDDKSDNFNQKLRPYILVLLSTSIHKQNFIAFNIILDMLKPEKVLNNLYHQDQEPIHFRVDSIGYPIFYRIISSDDMIKSENRYTMFNKIIHSNLGKEILNKQENICRLCQDLLLQENVKQSTRLLQCFLDTQPHLEHKTVDKLKKYIVEKEKYIRSQEAVQTLSKYLHYYELEYTLHSHTQANTISKNRKI